MSARDEHSWIVSDPEFQADDVVPLNPVYPWSGHRNFAYDLVRWMKPARIVELGVHWGTSFFAFAQAIKDHRLQTELVGVDTFKGDEHAGAYGDEVLAAVRTIIDRYFAARPPILHQMFFSEALDRVADGSADIIHIDGLHTHEAARFDFTAWLPKLAPEGVMLLHDIAPSTGYGSANFWKELAAKHPSFAFEHSWGLGVVFPRGDSRLRDLRAQNLDDKIPLYTYRAEFRLAEIKVRDLSRLAEQRYAAVQDQTRLIDQKEARIVALSREVELLARNRADLDAWLADLRKRANAAETFSNQLRAADKLCRERYESIQDLGRENHALRQELAATRERGAALEANLDQAYAGVHRLTAQVEALDKKLREKETMHAMDDEERTRLKRLEGDLELLALRTEHVEHVLEVQRARLDALMQTRVGRRAAARIPVLPAAVITQPSGNGLGPPIAKNAIGDPFAEPRG